MRAISDVISSSTEISQQLLPFAQVPNFIWTAPIGSGAKVYYGWLCSRANSYGVSYWSVEATARELNCSERSVQAWRAELEELGYISRRDHQNRATVLKVINHPKVAWSARQAQEQNQREKNEAESQDDQGCRNLQGGGADFCTQNNSQGNNREIESTSSSTDQQSCEVDTSGRDEAAAVSDFDFGTLWEAAEKAGYPEFDKLEPLFLKHPKFLKLLLNCSPDALVFAFRRIEEGKRELYPRSPGYWLQRLCEEVAFWHPDFACSDNAPHGSQDDQASAELDDQAEGNSSPAPSYLTDEIVSADGPADWLEIKRDIWLLGHERGKPWGTHELSNALKNADCHIVGHKACIVFDEFWAWFLVRHPEYARQIHDVITNREGLGVEEVVIYQRE